MISPGPTRLSGFCTASLVLAVALLCGLRPAAAQAAPPLSGLSLDAAPAPRQADDEQPFSAAAARPLLTGAQAVAAGYGHTCVVTADGGVQCWGDNDSGQLGDGTTDRRINLADVAGLGGVAQAVAAGRAHTCALLASGAVRCWGGNGSGQLGPQAGAAPFSAAPVEVYPPGSGVTAIRSGDDFTCALAAGGVQCWGNNDYGQLGAGVLGPPPAAPLPALPPSSGITLLGAGARHACAATSSSMYCWGSSSSGQVSIGAPGATAPMPVQVIGLPPGPILGIAAGGEHSCALVGAEVLCWGDNSLGQLGFAVARPPVPFPGPVIGMAGATAISAGHDHTCAVTPSNGVRCWGSNRSNLLGAGLREDVEFFPSPADVVGLSSGVQAVSAGPRHTCALMQGGGVKCWGINNATVLGTGRFLWTIPIPLHVENLPSAVTAISLGDDHTCAILDGGALTCWGSNSSGQLGDGMTFSRYFHAPVTGLGSGVTNVASGAMHTCAVQNGGAFCWGDNGSGQLGDGEGFPRYAPFALGAPISDASIVAAGFKHSCAVVAGGAFCWGDNGNGKLGDGTATSSLLPVPVSGLGSGVTTVAAGHFHTCAVQSGAVRCWGSNTEGQLGSSSGSSNVPVDVTLPSSATAVVAGMLHTCALTSGDGLFCWGNNDYGQLGDGSTDSRWAPVAVAGLGAAAHVTALAAGETNTCALRADGAVLCWGDNSHRQLNADTGDETYSATPLRVAGLPSPAQAIGVGYSHACAVLGGGVHCWGDNYMGQAGQPNGAIPSDVLAGAVETYPISGRVTWDGAPLGGVTVTAGGQSAATDGSGSYTLLLPDGSYTVSATKRGYTFAPASAEVTLPRPNPLDAAQVDFTADAIPYSVSGRVTLNGAGLAGVTVSAGDRSAVSAANGTYSITGLIAGGYTITPSQPGYTFDPAARQVTLGPDAAGVDFAARADTPGDPPDGTPTFTLSGRVTLDGAGLAGVTVSAGSRSAVSAANGAYSITGLVAGEHTVTPSKPGYTFDPGTRRVTLGPATAGIDFAARATGAPGDPPDDTPAFTLSGRVTLDGAGLGGVTVSAGSRSAVSDAGGGYAIAGLRAGEVVVSAAKAGYAFDPAARRVRLGPDAAGIDFAARATGAPGDPPDDTPGDRSHVYLPAVQR